MPVIIDAKASDNAICFGESNTKTAALFFDKILPLTLDEMLPSGVVRYRVGDISPMQFGKADRIFTSFSWQEFTVCILIPI